VAEVSTSLPTRVRELPMDHIEASEERSRCAFLRLVKAHAYRGSPHGGSIISASQVAPVSRSPQRDAFLSVSVDITRRETFHA